MTPTPLTGFVIHARPYQEKRAIYTLFCQNIGLIDGVGGRGLPLFCELSLFATGKNSLKTFKESVLLNNADRTMTAPFLHYACLYLNELIYRLFAKEDDMGVLYDGYKQALFELKALQKINDPDRFDKRVFIKAVDTHLWQNTPITHNFVKQHPKIRNLTQTIKPILRQFERMLFEVLGVSLDFSKDHLGQALLTDGSYQFKLEQGFVRVFDQDKYQNKHQDKHQNKHNLTGRQIQQMGHNVAHLDSDFLDKLGYLHKMLIDFLLEYKPLNSRKLWQDYQRLINMHSN